MFYQEDEISRELACRKCGQNFQDPRVLPCGETMCQRCVQELVFEGNRLACLFCNEVHSIVVDELPENKLVHKLVDIKSSVEGRSPKVHNVEDMNLDELERILDGLERRCRELKHISTASSLAEIRNYSEHLRSDIEITTQSTLEYVNKFHDELIEQVNAYEKECVNNIKNKAEEFKSFQKLVLNVENFHNEWKNKLFKTITTPTKISADTKNCNDDISEALRTGKQHLKTLQLEEVKRKRAKFNDKMLLFKETTNTLSASSEDVPSCAKLLGQLVYSTRIKSVNNQFVDLINLDALPRFNHVCVERLDNHSLVLVGTTISSSNEFNSKLILMNGSEPWTILRQSDLTRTRFDVIFTSRHLNTLFTCLVVNFNNLIQSFDERLEPVASINVADSPINSFASNSTHLFAWSSIGSKIYSFAHDDLRLVRTVSLNVLRPDQPFYMPRFVNRMLVDERHLYLVDCSSHVTLMSLDGNIVQQRRFKLDTLDGCQCGLFTSSPQAEESRLVAFDRENARLVTYDPSSGERVGERKLSGTGVNAITPDDLTLVNVTSLGELFMLSALENAFYVFLV